MNEPLENAVPLRGIPIYESGARVKLAQRIVDDPACKVSAYIGQSGIVRHMIRSENGVPCEWCAVYWPFRDAVSVWHADALELSDPK